MALQNLDDPKNVAGLSSLLDNDDLESNFDISELEKEIANGAAIDEEESFNLADAFKQDMEKIRQDFDIGSSIKKEPTSPTNSIKSNYDNSFNRSEVVEPEVVAIPDEYFNEIKTNDKKNSKYNDEQFNRMTEEEVKQSKIRDVLTDINDTNDFDIETEKEDDDKSSLLEQIDMLKITLEDDGIDISGVPLVDKNSSAKDMQTVYKVLRLKNDRNRYCSFAEELILAGAYGLEHVFDGKKEWFNRKPDLVGWPDTVKIKLRRMRYETSTFVHDVMQEYNMSSGMRLLLELIPSMFLYTRSRRLSQNDNIVSDAQYKSAISKMNSMS